MRDMKHPASVVDSTNQPREISFAGKNVSTRYAPMTLRPKKHFSSHSVRSLEIFARASRVGGTSTNPRDATSERFAGGAASGLAHHRLARRPPPARPHVRVAT